nr:hypothetical protein [uncultured archaeon]
MSETDSELRGLVFLIQEYKETLRAALPMAKEIVEEIGSLMNQCTTAIRLLESPSAENVQAAKRIITSIIVQFGRIYEEMENDVEEGINSEEEEDLTFLSDFLNYSSSNGSS